MTRKCRIIDVIYNASNNELVRTKTLVKGAVVAIDAGPFKNYYSSHYGIELGKKNAKKEVLIMHPDFCYMDHNHRMLRLLQDMQADLSGKSNHVQRKLQGRDKARQNNPAFFDQFVSGRLLAQLSSRPGQSGGHSFTPFVLLARIMRAPFLSNRSAYAGVDAKPSVLGAGRADGYILEGKELDFYLRKLRESKRG